MSQLVGEDIQTPTISLHTNKTLQPTSNHLIFFVTGNPGLVHYYTTFLETLQNLLLPDSKENSANIHIYGQSQAGFSDEDVPLSTTPYSLEHQILISLSRLELLTKSQNYDKIALMGHSMGSYIILEIIRRSSLNITGAILLFPTVTHIAQSPSGVKITKLFRIPEFPRRASLTAKLCLSMFPNGVLKWLVGVVTGMPTEASKVTTGFLRSKMGIWQALQLAKDEIETITEDQWDDEIWGIEKHDAKTSQKPTKLIFYFGQNDHWVADHTRDALISSRGQTEDTADTSRPLMIIDQDNVPHGFCIKHSEIMAEKTKLWVGEILWT